MSPPRHAPPAYWRGRFQDGLPLAGLGGDDGEDMALDNLDAPLACSVMPDRRRPAPARRQPGPAFGISAPAAGGASARRRQPPREPIMDRPARAGRRTCRPARSAHGGRPTRCRKPARDPGRNRFGHRMAIGQQPEHMAVAPGEGRDQQHLRPGDHEQSGRGMRPRPSSRPPAAAPPSTRCPYQRQTGGHGPRHRAAAEGVPDGRTAVEPRRQTARSEKSAPRSARSSTASG